MRVVAGGVSQQSGAEDEDEDEDGASVFGGERDHATVTHPLRKTSAQAAAMGNHPRRGARMGRGGTSALGEGTDILRGSPET